MHDNIAEFAPLWRAEWPFVNAQNALSLALLTALAAASLRGPWRVRGLAALGGAIALAVLHARHIVLAVVVSASVLTPALDDVMDGILEAPTEGARAAARWAALPGLAVALVVTALLSRQRSFPDWTERLGGQRWCPWPRPSRETRGCTRRSKRRGLAVALSAAGRARLDRPARNDCFRAATLAVGFAIERGTVTEAVLTETMARTQTDVIVGPRGHLAARWALRAPGLAARSRRGSVGAWAQIPRRGHGAPVAGLIAPG